jgi:signal transduction histidine kinase
MVRPKLKYCFFAVRIPTQKKSVRLKRFYCHLKKIKIITIGANSKLLIARDITQRNKTLEMRKSFISNASHELRTLNC